MADKHEPPPPKHEAPKTEPGFKPDDLKTEQEKAKMDPVTPSEPIGTKAETIEDLGIGPREPYPDGDPPKPVDAPFYKGQGVKGVTDKPEPKPAASKR